MDVAINYHSIDELDSFNRNVDQIQFNKVNLSIIKIQEKIFKNAVNSLFGQFGELKVSRLYFGSEFCEWLVPTIDLFDSLYNFIIKNDIKLTLLTPLVTDKGISIFKNLLNHIYKNNLPIEIVINDCGMLNLINREFPNIKMIAGRLLHKMINDPRIKKNLEAIKKQFGNEIELMVYLQNSAFSLSDYQDFLLSKNITQAELDLVFQGISIPNNNKLSYSLHLPYTYITSGRHCFFSALNKPFEKKFELNNQCEFECKKYIVENKLEGINDRIYQRGKVIVNSFYSEVPLSSLPWNVISRIILSPFVPY